MSGRIKWIERRFDFSFPVGLYPEMIERLRGTPARVEDRLRSIPVGVLTRRDGERWSIQENIGHLLDLETLITLRLDEYDAGAEVLHAADMSNRKTHEARHNERPVETILSEFRRERMKLVKRLEDLDPGMFARTAIHPRLNVRMRVVDMLFFQAEHDDYHLARITELARLFTG
ncbi:MAG TPA: DinB family protein [Pyrinomonadaceae bacterium]|nr:DinB family protein [Pyrinomonadaceae bacterium]